MGKKIVSVKIFLGGGLSSGHHDLLSTTIILVRVLRKSTIFLCETCLTRRRIVVVKKIFVTMESLLECKHGGCLIQKNKKYFHTDLIVEDRVTAKGKCKSYTYTSRTC